MNINYDPWVAIEYGTDEFDYRSYCDEDGSIKPLNLDDFPTEEEKCEAIWNYLSRLYYAEEALTLLTTLHGYTLDELKAAYQIIRESNKN